MKTYRKGAAAERELLHFFNHQGFSCMRQASSGGHTTPVDIIAMRSGITLAFECKNHARKPYLQRDKLHAFRDWCQTAGAMGFLAWRTQGRWLFLKVEDADQGNYQDGKWIEIQDLLSAFGID